MHSQYSMDSKYGKYGLCNTIQSYDTKVPRRHIAFLSVFLTVSVCSICHMIELYYTTIILECILYWECILYLKMHTIFEVYTIFGSAYYIWKCQYVPSLYLECILYLEVHTIFGSAYYIWKCILYL